MQQDMNSQVWRSLFTSGGGGGRGLENKQGQYKFVDGSRSILLPPPPTPPPTTPPNHPQQHHKTQQKNFL